MNDTTRPPPMDPWAPGVRANDVPVVNDNNGLPEDIFFGFERDIRDEPSLAPNLRDITHHLYALFQPDFVKDFPDAWIEIAFARPETGGDPKAAKHFSPFDLKAAAEFAGKKNAAGYNIYVGPSLRQGTTGPSGRSSGENYLASTHTWIDYDDADGQMRVSDRLGSKSFTNSMLVMTGSTPHPRGQPYFRMLGNPTGDQLQQANTALRDWLGGDDVTAPCNLMRLAGTINYPTKVKRARGYVPELVTLHIRKDPPVYSIQQLLTAAGVPPSPEPTGKAEYNAETIDDARKAAYGQSALAEMETELAAAPEGSRNNEAARCGFKAGQLVGGNCLSASEAYERLAATALSWGVKSKDRALGPKGTIARAIKAGIGKPRGPADAPDVGFDLSALLGYDPNTGEVKEGKSAGVSNGAGSGASAAATVIDPVDLWAKFDPPALPLNLLPGVIADFATDRSRTMGCDISSLAIGALSVCAAAIPQGIKLQPKKNDTEWQEAPRLWVMLVGDPSTMKTPGILATTKPLKHIDNGLANDYQEAFEKWARLPKEDQKKTPKPKKLRAMIFNTTIESVQEILKDSPNGVLLEDDELSGWFDSIYKYTGARGAQTDRAFWMKAYNGGSHTVDRITRGQTYISHLSVSILGGVQPGPISKLAKVGDDDGLMQRFIPIMACPAGLGRDEAPGDAVKDYAQLIEDLRALEPPPNAGYVFPPTVPLTFDINALKIREQLELKHLDLMKTESLNRKLASHFGKYNGIYARLCVIFHCIEHCTRRDRYGAKIKGELSSIVTGDTARRVADFLHGFLKPHAIAFHVNVLGLANDHDRMTNVADYILAHGLTRVTNRDVQRGDQTMRDLERRETDAIFEQLEALGWVDVVPSPRRGYPPHWVVNPAVHQKFAERAKEAKERRERGREMAREISAAIKSSRATTEE